MSSLPLDTDLAEKKQPKELSAANATGTLASLLDEVVWRTPGCSDLERRKALSEAARDFCDRTNCWQEPVRWPGPPPSCMGHHPIAMPNGAVALRIRENTAWIVGRQTIRWRGFPGLHPLLDWRRFDPWPPFLCGRAPTPIVAFAPAPGSEEIDEDVLARWGHAFVDGACAKLLAMLDKPWGDKGRLVYQQHASAYSAAVAEARAEAEGIYQHGQPRGLGPLSTLPEIPFI